MRLVSGGQSGVDRAALDAALELGLDCGGWCPRGRLAEDGRIHGRYPLRETATDEYAERTRLNVRDSDATLVLTRGRPSGGTGLTVHLARGMGRPCLVVDLAAPRLGEVDAVGAWMAAHGVAVLNVAGPRQSTAPGIHQEALDFLRRLLA